jgi:hypothetical protein
MHIPITDLLAFTKEFLGLLLVIWAVFERSKRKIQEQVVLGFLHGIKPSIVSASRGDPIPASTWAGAVEQIHDMMERLQPPKRR